MKTQLVAKVVVVDDHNHVLLLRRSQTDTRRPGQWDLPGGAVEDETASVACARELKEEADVAIEARDLQLVRAESAVMSNPQGAHNFTWMYYSARVSVRPNIKLSFEHDSFAWYSLDEAIRVSEYDRQRRTLEYIRDNSLLDV